jgi:hypothetical protein
VGQGDGWNLLFRHQFNPNQILAIVPQGGAAVRRVKISENNSPLPQCRVFFNYNFFNDVYAGIGDVNRYTAGAEWAFNDKCSSLEVRAPFASTIDSTQTVGAIGHGTEFGNVTLTYKQVWRQSECAVITYGLGVAIPTSRDARLLLPSGQEALHVDSEAVHLLPYVALLNRTTERLFWQSFIQLDFDCNGNPVHAGLPGPGLDRIGVIQDSALLFIDFGMGYTFYENECAQALTAAAALLELHYSTTLQDADTVQGNGFVVRDFDNRFDVLNLTAGVNFMLQHGASIRPAMVVPLRTGNDRQFDYEAVVQANWSF